MMLTGKITNGLKGRGTPLEIDVNGSCLMTKLKQCFKHIAIARLRTKPLKVECAKAIIAIECFHSRDYSACFRPKQKKTLS